MDIGAQVKPWMDLAVAQVPGVRLFDAHTHLGEHDPDGMRQSPEELIAVLHDARAIGCFVFPMHEPDGYPPANDMVLRAAREAPAELLVPFCRVDPRRDAIAEAERALDAGARGIKLHPRAEQFGLDEPVVRDLFALAHERSLPILIHAGRGIPALGAHVFDHAQAFPDARVILAHAGITDLSWIWRVAPDAPNLLFDSSWWIPADLLTLFSLVPPGQIVFASDAPYGHTAVSGALQIRLMLQAGLSEDQIRLVCSEQSLHIARSEPPQPGGPAVGEREAAPHLLLDRLANFLQIGTIMSFRGDPVAGAEMLALARLAANVPDEIDDAPVFAAVRTLLDAYDRATEEDPEDRRRLALLMMANTVTRTPDVPLPSSA